MSIYRFAQRSTNPAYTGIAWETGANYPGCSPSNPAACQPLTFVRADGSDATPDLLAYCAAHGETAVQVASSAEAFLYISGAAPIPQSQIMSAGEPWWIWAAAAYVAYRFFF